MIFATKPIETPLNPLIAYAHMRIVKIIIIAAILFGTFHILSAAIASDAEKTPVSVVPNSPVAATCQYVGSKTVIRVAATDDISDVHLSFPDGQDVAIIPTLQKGWSVAQTVSGQYQSVTVVFSWRGSEKRVPIPCH